MSPAEFLSTENCQCLVLLFPRLHCVVHACIQMWFSEIVLLTSTIITVASSYQLMSPFNCFFPVGWSIYMLSYVSNGVCRLSGCKILSECYLCCSDLLGHSFDMKVLPFYPWLPECFTSETRVRRGNSFGVLPKENNKGHPHFSRMWILASNNWSTSMLLLTPPQGICIWDHSFYPTWYNWEFWHGSRFKNISTSSNLCSGLSLSSTSREKKHSSPSSVFQLLVYITRGQGWSAATGRRTRTRWSACASCRAKEWRPRG